MWSTELRVSTEMWCPRRVRLLPRLDVSMYGNSTSPRVSYQKCGRLCNRDNFSDSEGLLLHISLEYCLGPVTGWTEVEMKPVIHGVHEGPRTEHVREECRHSASHEKTCHGLLLRGKRLAWVISSIESAVAPPMQQKQETRYQLWACFLRLDSKCAHVRSTKSHIDT